MEKTVTNTRLSAGMGPRTVMQHCYVELLSAPMIRVTLAVVATVSIAMAAVGPAGSFEALSMLERMMSSALYAGICAPIFYSLGVVTAYLCRFRKPFEMIIALAGMSMYVAFPLGTAVYTIEGFAHPDYSEAIGLLPIYLSVATSAVACSILMSYLAWQRVWHAAPVTARSDPDRALATATREVNAATPPPNQDVSPAGAVQDESANSPAHPNGDGPVAELIPSVAQRVATPRPGRQPRALLRLLPQGLGTDLIYIKSEDHYLEVHTTVGSSLIKMRFSAAVAELGDRGVQVHRSYWVANGHVTRSVRNGKRTLLRLKGDHKVPVSLTYLPAVRAMLARSRHSASLPPQAGKGAHA